MKKCIFIVALSALCGCLEDHPDTWEYYISIPGDTTPEQILKIHNDLEKHGFRRIRVRSVDLGRAIIVQATKTEAKKEGKE